MATIGGAVTASGSIVGAGGKVVGQASAADRPRSSGGGSSPSPTLAGNTVITQQNIGSLLASLSPYMTPEAQKAVSVGSLQQPTLNTQLTPRKDESSFTGLMESALASVNLAQKQPQTQQTQSVGQQILSQLYEDRPESNVDLLQRMKSESGILDQQRRVDDLRASIEMEQARTSANLLKLRGVGATEGVTEAVYGGQQATIERESAIRLLPLTAQYNAESGRLQSAEKNLAELYGAIVADRQAERQYKQQLYSFAYQVARDEQKDLLDASREETRIKEREEDNFLATKKELSDLAKSAGDYKLAGEILGASNQFELDTKAAAIQATKGFDTSYEARGLTPEESNVLNGLRLEPRQKEIVAAIVRGQQPPITTIQRTPEITGILGGLAALGYDNTKAVQDWTSMQKRLQSMNSTQQLRLSQAIFALEGSTEQAERLYADWQSTGLPTGFSTFNRAALEIASRMPGEAGVAAATLKSHIEDMAAELAVIYRGGNSPTDQAFEAARKSLNEDWNPAQFSKNLELIKQNLRIRQNSITNSSQVAGNIYSPQVQPMQDVFESSVPQADMDIFDDVVSQPSGYWSNLFKSIIGK